jgi:hypothetical protein
VAKTNISLLVTESKFLPEEVLQALMKAIARATEFYTLPEGSADAQVIVDYENLAPMESLCAADTDWLPLHSATHRVAFSVSAGFSKVLREVLLAEKICASISSSSMAWLEVILVELALRNRDRFQVCWPILRAHYLRSLGSVSFKLSYVAERYSPHCAPASPARLCRQTPSNTVCCVRYVMLCSGK